jgi:hypothetical protein
MHLEHDTPKALATESEEESGVFRCSPGCDSIRNREAPLSHWTRSMPGHSFLKARRRVAFQSDAKVTEKEITE